MAASGSEATVISTMRSISLKRYLLRLIIGILVPTLLITFGLVAHLYQVQRDLIGRSMLDVADATLMTIERDLAIVQGIAATIAESAHIDDRNVDALYEFVQRIAARRPNARISLVEPSGRGEHGRP